MPIFFTNLSKMCHKSVGNQIHRHGSNVYAMKIESSSVEMFCKKLYIASYCVFICPPTQPPPNPVYPPHPTQTATMFSLDENHICQQHPDSCGEFESSYRTSL